MHGMKNLKWKEMICFARRLLYPGEEPPVPLNKGLVGLRIRFRDLGEDIKLVTQAGKDP